MCTQAALEATRSGCVHGFLASVGADCRLWLMRELYYAEQDPELQCLLDKVLPIGDGCLTNLRSLGMQLCEGIVLTR